jgi:excisionase family DNA binding protein
MQPQNIFLQGLTPDQLVEAIQPAIRFAVAEAVTQAVAAALGQTAGTDEKWTVEASAEYLNISRATLFEWLRRGLLPSTKLGGRTYLLRSNVLAAGTQRQRTAKPSRVKGKPPAK